MPLRGLMYFAKLYESYIDKNALNVYSSKLLKIPTSKYVVLYNGTQDQPAVKKLRLSDSFKADDSEAAGEFEWTATMINISREKNPELLEKCTVLGEYMELIDRIRIFKNNYNLGLEDAVDQAVRSCIEDEILVDFLKKHRAEVVNVCMTEFNEKAFVASIKAEGREEGRLEGLEEKGIQNALTMLKDKMAEALVAKYSGLSLEEVQALAATLQKE